MAVFTAYSFIPDTMLGDLYTPFHFVLASLQSRCYHPYFTDKEEPEAQGVNLLKVTIAGQCQTRTEPQVVWLQTQSYFHFTILCPIYQVTVAVLECILITGVSLNIMSRTINKHLLNACYIPEWQQMLWEVLTQIRFLPPEAYSITVA